MKTEANKIVPISRQEILAELFMDSSDRGAEDAFCAKDQNDRGKIQCLGQGN